MPRMGHAIFQALHDTQHIPAKQIQYFMCGNYIVQAEKHIGLPNQRYHWFASMDFLYFSLIINKTIGLKLL